MSELIEHQPPSPATGAGAPWAQLQTLLVAGETVVAFALQHRLYALIHRRQVAAATSGRFIFLKRPLLGGYLPLDVRWQDVKDVQITVGMFTAAVVLTYSANLSDTAEGEGEVHALRVASLKIEAAQALYRECQAQGQAWREKRRVRSIEEMRAQSGGVQIATGVYPQADLAGDRSKIGAAPHDDPATRLSRAKAMLDQGLITDPEFEAIKAKVIGGL